LYNFFRQLDVLIYPPAINILLLLAALMFWQKRRLAFTLVSFSLLTLLVFSLPATSRLLMQGLEVWPAILPAELTTKRAQAIVVLGGGIYPAPTEYPGATLTESSFTRLRYAAFIHHQTGLPILASGGYTLSPDYSEAGVMRQILAQDFGIRGVWVEESSRTTEENAKFSIQILRERGIDRIYLVSHGIHLKRAMELFKRYGMEAIAAPTALFSDEPQSWKDALPSGQALENTQSALHEYLGRLAGFVRG